MSTKHAVLGLLVQRRDYGYRLRLRLEEQLGVRGVQGNMVYRALEGLEQDGMIREIDEPSEEPRRGVPRVMYEATEQGVAHFERWLRDSSPVKPLRDELNVKIATSKSADLPELIELTWAQERECLTQLRELEAIPSAPQASKVDPWPRAAAMLVRNAQIGHLQARVQSLQRSRAVMERLSKSPEASCSGRRKAR